jgi:hypothetical protein
MNRVDIHKQVIERYGSIKQIDKAKEELIELRDELIVFFAWGTREEVKSEIADVRNCIEQLKLILDISDAETEQEQDRKMKRTVERMEGK